MPIPFNIVLGSANLRDTVHFDTIRIEETGTFESITASLAIRDKALAWTAMRGEVPLRIEWRPTGETLFRGFVRRPSREPVVTEHGLSVEADGLAFLLDRCINTRAGVERAAGEKMKARIGWLFGELTHTSGSAWSGTRIAQALLAQGFDYTTHVQGLSDNLPKQRFAAGLTLRQMLERILGVASDSANYYVDGAGALHVFDDANPEDSRTAPYEIKTAHSLAGDEVAPEDLTMDWDTDRLINGYQVRGKNAAGSGFFTDQDLLPGPHSVNLFGPRFIPLDGPDSDTAAKAQRLAKAALRDTRNPIPRISWTLSGEDKAVNGSGTRWQGGQRVYVTSTALGLNGSGVDAGPWAGTVALQPFRIARVITSLINGDGDRKVEIEAGARKRRRYEAIAA